MPIVPVLCFGGKQTKDCVKAFTSLRDPFETTNPGVSQNEGILKIDRWQTLHVFCSKPCGLTVPGQCIEICESHFRVFLGYKQLNMMSFIFIL